MTVSLSATAREQTATSMIVLSARTWAMTVFLKMPNAITDQGIVAMACLVVINSTVTLFLSVTAFLDDKI